MPALNQGARVTLLGLALVAVGCRPAVHERPPPSALARTYPVLDHVPADAAYAVAAARTADAVLALRQLAQVYAMGWATTAQALGARLRARIGIDPFDATSVAGAGIALDRSCALFEQGGYPTLLVPVASAPRLQAFLDRVRPDRGASMARHGKSDVYIWSQGGWEIDWLLQGRWLAVHLGPSGSDSRLSWIDAIAAAPDRANLSRDPDLSRAAARGLVALPARGPARPRGATPAGAGLGLVGIVRPAQLAAALLAALPVSDSARASARATGTCLARIAAVAPRIYLGGATSWDGASGWIGVDLAPEVARALRRHLGPPAPAGFYAYRAAAPLALSWAVAPALLERARRALRPACPWLDRPIVDPVKALTGAPAPRAIHLAAVDLDPEKLAGAGALVLSLADRSLIDTQLGAIPARSLFERSRTIAGREVKLLSLPGVPSLYYRLTAHTFTLTLGRAAMARILAPGAGTVPADPELFHIHIAPGRLPHLAALLGAALTPLWGSRLGTAAARALAAQLSRYRSASLGLVLDGDSVALRARMRLQN